MVILIILHIDNSITTVGSANFNRQTMRNLSELNVNIKDKEFSTKVKESIKEQIQKSTKVSDFEEIKYNKIKAFLEGFVC